MSNLIHTTCAYCGVGCGLTVEKRENGAIDIRGDRDHPANFGRLCAKGASLGETLELDHRLLYPQAFGQRRTWASALDTVANEFRTAIDEYGPDSVAFYVSGQLLTEDYYVANKLMKGFIGSGNIDTNSRLCMASSVAGHKRAFGEDIVPGVYEDFELADLVILVGSNLAWCHPVLSQRLLEAKHARGTKIVVIDPRETATTDYADLHLQIAPGSDVALFNGLLNYLIHHDHIDQPYIDSHTAGFDDVKPIVDNYGVPKVAAITHESERKISEFYRLFVEHDAALTVYSQGVNQSTAGSDKVNAIINLHLATGRIGQAGAGPFSVTGQPNAMGGRETGGLANTLAAHIDFQDTLGASAVAEFWSTRNLAEKPGLKAVDLFDAVKSGQIRALWIMSTNPAVSMPQLNAVEAALSSCPFVVVSDVVTNSASNRYAEVLLPAAGWGEKNGTVTNSERRISRQRAFVDAPGEAKPDWWIICEIAKRLGYGEAFSYPGPQEIFDEYARLTEVRSANQRQLKLSGIMQKPHTYETLAPTLWPIKNEDGQALDGRLFSDGQFSTPSGRANFVPTDYRAPADTVSTKYPYQLTSGRVRDHWHTMTRSINASQLSIHLGEPYVEIDPQDAAQHAIEPADLVKISSACGSVTMRALVTPRVKRGQMFVPMHWSASYASDAAVNRLFGAHVDATSGQPELKHTVVDMTKFDVKWFGFAASIEDASSPAVQYWAKKRLPAGWSWELAGNTLVGDFRNLFQHFYAEADKRNKYLSYHDAAAGRHRFAQISDGKLTAVLFVSREPVAVSRAYISELIGSALDDRQHQSLLSGSMGVSGEDTGPIVCTCLGVGQKTIEKAIFSGAFSIAEVGAKTAAGTNCGSCRFQIQHLVEENQLSDAM